MDILVIAIAVIILILFFNFSNGFHDAPNIVTTVISSRSMSLRKALLLTAILEFIGAYFLGTAVAKTIGQSLIMSGTISIHTVIAATCAAILWNFITWFYGMPSSSSHALIGGLIGATCVAKGIHVIHWEKLTEVIIVIMLSPIIGFISGFFFTNITSYSLSNIKPVQSNNILKRLQLVSAAFLALAHGTNDAQKSMGLITLSLLILYPLDPNSMSKLYPYGESGAFVVPNWVIGICSFAIMLGMLSGGKRIIRTVGFKLYKIRPIHGFGAQIACATVVYICALFGFPISTTHVAASAIMGAGTAQRINIVRWGIGKSMALAWVITIPISFIIGMILAILIKYVSP